MEPCHSGRARVCLVSPTAYRVGMSSLSLQAVYALLSRTGQVTVERAFLPAEGDACRSLETGTHLAQFDAIAFSAAFELDYLRVPRMLHSAGLPPRREDRADRHPLVIAGGAAVTSNPLPLADFVDAFVIGEVETIAGDLAAALGEQTKGAQLEALAALPGVYVPSRHDGRPVERLATPDLDDWPTHSIILTPHAEFANCFLVEVGRGCGRLCRFCLAAHIHRPLRQRSVASLLRTARQGLQHTDRLGLLGAALSDYRDIGPLAADLAALGARISTSSLRTESVTPELVAALAQGGQRQITLAPEAGTGRLRGVIRKPTSDDDLRAAIETALAAGLTDLKLYFMVGLPTETDEDVEAIAALVSSLKREFPRARFGVSLAPFVPKPHTPFQWAPMAPLAMLEQRVQRLRRALVGQARFEAESCRWSVVQAILARGGMELGEVVATAAAGGGTATAFFRALAKSGHDPDAYLAPDQDLRKPLPWDFVATAEARRPLWRQWQQAVAT